MRPAYYNENDKKAAAWLRELIKAGVIANGDVDDRSIVEVQGSDLSRYGQCHFFAGIGGWSYALRVAGVRDDEPVWTGSCPCQPFSAAGKQKGEKDERHLWPEFWRLIRERSPHRIFGEQVASSIGFGWIDGVRADLETEAYALGIAVLGAHSVGSPHIRQRLYWVADTLSAGWPEGWPESRGGQATRCIGSGRLGNSDGPRRSRWGIDSGEYADQFALGETGTPGGMGESEGIGLRRRPDDSDGRWRECASGPAGKASWSDFDILHCTDGKARRIEAGTFPLATGIPARMGRLRGYGNAIVPQAAAEFISAAKEVIGDHR